MTAIPTWCRLYTFEARPQSYGQVLDARVAVGRRGSDCHPSAGYLVDLAKGTWSDHGAPLDAFFVSIRATSEPVQLRRATSRRSRPSRLTKPCSAGLHP